MKQKHGNTTVKHTIKKYSNAIQKTYTVLPW